MSYVDEEKENQEFPPIGEAMLFYGCRRHEDFIYREDMHDFVQVFFFVHFSSFHP